MKERKKYQVFIRADHIQYKYINRFFFLFHLHSKKVKREIFERAALRKKSREIKKNEQSMGCWPVKHARKNTACRQNIKSNVNYYSNKN